jgi:hypothetical protein
MFRPDHIIGLIRVKYEYSSPTVSAGDTFQDLPRMPETADSTEHYIQKRKLQID